MATAGSSSVNREVIRTERVGPLTVIIQGDIWARGGRAVLLSLHDLGSGPRAMVDFTTSEPALRPLLAASVWLHVALPKAGECEYPSLEDIAEALRELLDAFSVRTVVGFAEGVGTNILVRLGLRHPNRLLGLVLIDPVAGPAKPGERLRRSVSRLGETRGKLGEKMTALLFRSKEEEPPRRSQEGLQDVWLERDDLTPRISQLKVETLLVNGRMSPDVAETYAFQRLNPAASTLVVFDGTADPLREKSFKLAQALILFLKSCGVCMGVPLVGLEAAFAALEDGTWAQHGPAAASIAKGLQLLVMAEKETEEESAEGRPTSKRTRLGTIHEDTDSD